MRRSTLPITWLVACGVVACLLPNPAHGIPAFARKYRMSCTTCHAPFPRLTSFGEDFAARGFRLEDATQEPARATVDTGDPLLQLPREFPIAVRLEGAASWKEDADAENDLEWPWVWKILSGGPIGKQEPSFAFLRRWFLNTVVHFVFFSAINRARYKFSHVIT